MRKTTKTKTFSLDEVKQRAIEKNRSVNVSSCDWYEEVICNWTEKLESFGFANPKIHLSGSIDTTDSVRFTYDETEPLFPEPLRAYLCNEIRKDLLNEYSYFTSDRVVEQTLVDFGYRFHKDGSISITKLNINPDGNKQLK